MDYWVTVRTERATSGFDEDAFILTRMELYTFLGKHLLTRCICFRVSGAEVSYYIETVVDGGTIDCETVITWEEVAI